VVRGLSPLEILQLLIRRRLHMHEVIVCLGESPDELVELELHGGLLAALVCWITKTITSVTAAALTENADVQRPGPPAGLTAH